MGNPTDLATYHGLWLIKLNFHLSLTLNVSIQPNSKRLIEKNSWGLNLNHFKHSSHHYFNQCHQTTPSQSRITGHQRRSEVCQCALIEEPKTSQISRLVKDTPSGILSRADFDPPPPKPGSYSMSKMFLALSPVMLSVQEPSCPQESCSPSPSNNNYRIITVNQVARLGTALLREGRITLCNGWI